MRLASILVLVAACSAEVGSSGTTDASAGDAAVSDTPPNDTQLALCARSGLLFCEDFEGLPLGPATSTSWTTEAASGQLAIDATHARGQHALKVTTTGNGRARLMKTGLAPP